MSATNRGGKRSEADNYPTPEWVTRALLDRLNLSQDTAVLDPCAGDGAILRAVGRPERCYAMEIRRECRKPLIDAAAGKVIFGDALMESGGDICAVIMNPPFSLAREFIERYAHTATIGAVLLRLNYLEGQSRAAWWRARMPAEVYVLSRRPSFMGHGTDACAYAWFVWRRGVDSCTKLEVI